MRKEMILPGLAAVGGIAGLFLRRWELSTAFEAETGLHTAGMPATWALIIVSVVVAAALAFLCRDLHTNPNQGYDEAYSAKNDALYMTLTVAAGFLMAASGVLGILLWVQKEVAITRLLLGLFCLASAWSVIMVGKNNYRAEGNGRYSAFLLIPAYTCCLWLIAAYQARSADPVILDYVWQLFAIIAAVLGTYFSAGFAFERAKLFRSSYCSLMAIYFILVTMADKHDLSILLLLLAFLLYMAASAVVLLRNAGSPDGPRMPKRLLTEEND